MDEYIVDVSELRKEILGKEIMDPKERDKLAKDIAEYALGITKKDTEKKLKNAQLKLDLSSVGIDLIYPNYDKLDKKNQAKADEFINSVRDSFDSYIKKSQAKSKEGLELDIAANLKAGSNKKLEKAFIDYGVAISKGYKDIQKKYLKSIDDILIDNGKTKKFRQQLELLSKMSGNVRAAQTSKNASIGSDVQSFINKAKEATDKIENGLKGYASELQNELTQAIISGEKTLEQATSEFDERLNKQKNDYTNSMSELSSIMSSFGDKVPDGLKELIEGFSNGTISIDYATKALTKYKEELAGLNSNGSDNNAGLPSREELIKKLDILYNIQSETEDIAETQRNINKYYGEDLSGQDYDDLTEAQQRIVDNMESMEEHIEEMKEKYKSLTVVLKGNKIIDILSPEGFAFLKNGNFSKVLDVVPILTDDAIAAEKLERDIDALADKSELLSAMTEDIKNLRIGTDIEFDSSFLDSYFNNLINYYNMSEEEAKKYIEVLKQFPTLIEQYEQNGEDAFKNADFLKAFDELRQKAIPIIKEMGDALAKEIETIRNTNLLNFDPEEDYYKESSAFLSDWWSNSNLAANKNEFIPSKLPVNKDLEKETRLFNEMSEELTRLSQKFKNFNKDGEDAKTIIEELDNEISKLEEKHLNTEFKLFDKNKLIQFDTVLSALSTDVTNIKNELTTLPPVTEQEDSITLKKTSEAVNKLVADYAELAEVQQKANRLREKYPKYDIEWYDDDIDLSNFTRKGTLASVLKGYFKNDEIKQILDDAKYYAKEATETIEQYRKVFHVASFAEYEFNNKNIEDRIKFFDDIARGNSQGKKNLKIFNGLDLNYGDFVVDLLDGNQTEILNPDLGDVFHIWENNLKGRITDIRLVTEESLDDWRYSIESRIADIGYVVVGALDKLQPKINAKLLELFKQDIGNKIFDSLDEDIPTWEFSGDTGLYEVIEEAKETWKQSKEFEQYYKKYSESIQEINNWYENNTNRQLYPPTLINPDDSEKSIELISSYIDKLREFKNDSLSELLSDNQQSDLRRSIEILQTLINTTKESQKIKQRMQNTALLDDEIRKITGTTAGDEYSKYFEMLADDASNLDEILLQVRKDFGLVQEETKSSINYIAKFKDDVLAMRQNMDDIGYYTPNSDFEGGDYNNAKRLLNEYAKAFWDLKIQLDTLSTDAPQREIEELSDKVYEAAVTLQAAYDIINDYWDFKLLEPGNKGGASKNVKSAIDSINSEHGFLSNYNKIKNPVETTLPSFNTESTGQLAMQIEGVTEASWDFNNAEEELLENSEHLSDYFPGQISNLERLNNTLLSTDERIKAITAQIKEAKKIIRIQDMWKSVTSVVNKNFSTSGKKEAIEQLRHWADAVSNSRARNSDTNNRDGQDRAIIGWYRANQEALSKKVDNKWTSLYGTDITEFDYNDSLNRMIEQRNYAITTIEEQNQRIAELTSDLEIAKNPPLSFYNDQAQNTLLLVDETTDEIQDMSKISVISDEEMAKGLEEVNRVLAETSNISIENQHTLNQDALSKSIDETQIKIDLEKASVEELCEEYERLLALGNQLTDESNKKAAWNNSDVIKEKLQDLGYARLGPDDNKWIKWEIAKNTSASSKYEETQPGNYQHLLELLDGGMDKNGISSSINAQIKTQDDLQDKLISSSDLFSKLVEVMKKASDAAQITTTEFGGIFNDFGLFDTTVGKNFEISLDTTSKQATGAWHSHPSINAFPTIMSKDYESDILSFLEDYADGVRIQFIRAIKDTFVLNTGDLFDTYKSNFENLDRIKIKEKSNEILLNKDITAQNLEKAKEYILNNVNSIENLYDILIKNLNFENDPYISKFKDDIKKIIHDYIYQNINSIGDVIISELQEFMDDDGNSLSIDMASKFAIGSLVKNLLAEINNQLNGSISRYLKEQWKLVKEDSGLEIYTILTGVSDIGFNGDNYLKQIFEQIFNIHDIEKYYTIIGNEIFDNLKSLNDIKFGNNISPNESKNSSSINPINEEEKLTAAQKRRLELKEQEKQCSEESLSIAKEMLKLAGLTGEELLTRVQLAQKYMDTGNTNDMLGILADRVLNSRGLEKFSNIAPNLYEISDALSELQGKIKYTNNDVEAFGDSWGFIEKIIGKSNPNGISFDKFVQDAFSDESHLGIYNKIFKTTNDAVSGLSDVISYELENAKKNIIQNFIADGINQIGKSFKEEAIIVVNSFEDIDSTCKQTELSLSELESLFTDIYNKFGSKGFAKGYQIFSGTESEFDFLTKLLEKLESEKQALKEIEDQAKQTNNTIDEAINNENDLADAQNKRMLSTNRSSNYENGALVKSNRTATYTETPGRKVSISQGQKQKFDKETKEYYMVDTDSTKVITNYDNILNSAIKAQNTLNKAIDDFFIESQKENPNIDNLLELNNIIDDQTRKLIEARQAAKKYFEENGATSEGYFINDENYGTKYYLSQFEEDLDKGTRSDNAKENIRLNNELIKIERQKQQEISKNLKLENQEQEALNKLNLSIDKINESYSGNKKPLKDNNSIADVLTKEVSIRKEINDLEKDATTLTKEEFDARRIVIENEEKQLELLVSHYKDKEYSSTAMSPKDMQSNRESLDLLAQSIIQDAKLAGDFTSSFIAGIDDIRKEIKSLSNANDIKTIYDQLINKRKELSNIIKDNKLKLIDEKLISDSLSAFDTAIEKVKQQKDLINDIKAKIIDAETDGKPTNKLNEELDAANNKLHELEKSADDALTAVTKLFSNKQIDNKEYREKVNAYYGSQNYQGAEGSINDANDRKQSKEQAKQEKEAADEEAISLKNVEKSVDAVYIAYNKLFKAIETGKGDVNELINNLAEAQNASKLIINDTSDRGISQDKIKEAISNSTINNYSEFQKGIESAYSSISKSIDEYIKELNDSGNASVSNISKLEALRNSLQSLKVLYDSGSPSIETYVSSLKDIEGISTDNLKTIFENFVQLTKAKGFNGKSIENFLNNLKSKGDIAEESIEPLTEALQNFLNVCYAAKPEGFAANLNSIVQNFNDIKSKISTESETFKPLEDMLNSMDKVSFKSGKIQEFSNQLDILKDKLKGLKQDWNNLTPENQSKELEKLSNKIQVLKANASSYKEIVGGKKISSFNFGNIEDIDDLNTSLKQYLENIGATDIKIGPYTQDSKQLSATYKDQARNIVKVTAALDENFNAMRLSNSQVKSGYGFINAYGDNWKRALSSFSYYLGLAGLIRKTISAFKEGITTLKEFDSALTTISYTMDLTKEELNSLGQSAIDMAEDLSMSIDNAMEIYQIYANMQTSAQEIAETAKPTAILSNLSGVDASTAADQIQGVLQQFNMLKDSEADVADTSMHVVDVLDKISSNVAIDYAKGISVISEAVTTTGQVAYDAGMSYEQLAAISAKMAERTREDGSTIGNAMKTMFTRISKVASMPSYEDEIDNEEVSKAAAALSDIGIQVYKTSGEFRNITDIIGELNNKWDGLTDAQKSYISYQIAATRQSAKFKSMMEAWTEGMNLANEATEANGNALVNQEKYEDSYTGKLQEIQTQWQDFWLKVLNDDNFKKLLDNIIKITEKINDLADKTSAFGIVLTTVIGGSVLSTLLSGKFISNVLGIKSLSDAVNKLTKALTAKNSEEGIDTIRNGANAISEEADADAKRNKTGVTLEEAAASEFNAGATASDTIANETHTGSEVKDTAETEKNTIAKIKNAAASKAAALAANPEIFIALAAAIGLVTFGFISWYNSAENVVKRQQQIRDELIETTNKLKEEQNEYSSNAKSLSDLSQQLSEAVEGSEEYYEISNQIAELSPELVVGYTTEGDAIIANTEKIEEQTQAYLKNAEAKRLAAKESAEDASDTSREQYDKTLEKLNETQEDLDDALANPEKYIAQYGEATYNYRVENLRQQAKIYSDELSKIKSDLRQSYLDMTDPLSDQDIKEGKDKTQQVFLDYAESLLGTDKELSSTEFESQYNSVMDNYMANGAINRLFELDLDNMPLDEAKSNIDKYIQQIAEYWGVDSEDLIIALGFNDIDNFKDKFLKQNTIASGHDGTKINQAAIDFANSNKFSKSDYEKMTSDEYKKTLDDVTKSARHATPTLEDYSKAWEKINKAEEQTNKTAKFTKSEMIDSLNDLSDGFDKLDEIYADIYDKDGFDFSKLDSEKFEEAFGNLGVSYEDFIETVSGHTDDIEYCQEAFNNLVTEFVDKSGVLDGVSEATADVTKSMLKMYGVSNSDEIVQSVLDNANALKETKVWYNNNSKAIKEFDDSIKDSEDADKKKIDNLFNMAESAKIDTVALGELKIAEIAASDADMNFSSQIEELEELLAILGTDTSACYGLAAALNFNNQLERGQGTLYDYYSQLSETEQKEYTDNLISNAVEEAKESLKDLYVPDVEYTGADKTQSAKDSAESEKEILDWIEIAIQRVEEEVTRLGKTVSATYQIWSKRNTALLSEMSEVRKEISLQQSAYAAYMRDAEAVPLAESYKKLVREGALYSETITDKTLKKEIDNYKELYNKAISAKDAIDDLKSSLADLANTKFTNIKTEFEGFTSEIEHWVNLIDKQQSHVENMNKIAGKSFYNAKIDQYTSELSKMEEERSALVDALNAGVTSGAIEYGSEMWVNMRDEIYSLDESITDMTYNVEELKLQLKDVAKQDFDDLKTQFENAIGIITNATDLTDNIVSLVESTGHIVSQAYYKSLVDASNSQITALTKEYDTLQKRLSDAIAAGDVSEFDENWYDMQSSINDVKSSLVEATQQLVEYQNALRQIDWDLFDRMQEGLSSLTSEADFFIDLMEYEDLVKDGSYTDAGLATIGMHVQNYETYMNASKKYAEEIKEIEEEMANDPGNVDLIDRYNELNDAQHQVILSAYEQRDALKQLAQDAYDDLLDKIQELIDSYKDALSAEQSLRDYEKNVNEQTENINSLQKQLMAYSGDNSEETRATVQKLSQELKDAQDELEETEYDKYISDQEELLDNFLEDLNDWWEDRMDNIEWLLQDFIDITNLNSDKIWEKIQSESSANSDVITQGMNAVWTSADEHMTSTDDIITSVDTTCDEIEYLVELLPTEDSLEAYLSGENLMIVSSITSVESAVNNVNSSIGTMTDAINQISSKVTEYNASVLKSIASAQAAAEQAQAAANAAASSSSSSSSSSGSSSSGSSSKTTADSSSKAYHVTGVSQTFSTAAAANSYILDLARNKYTSTYNAALKKYSAANDKNGVRKAQEEAQVAYNRILSGMHVSYYAKGGLITDDDNPLDILAQSLGEDHMVAAKEGERILTEEQNESFEKLVNGFTALSPEEISKYSSLSETMTQNNLPDILGQIANNYPSVEANGNYGNTTTVGDVNITLPNVTDKQTFVNWLKTDGQVEKIIQSISVDRMMGGNRYNKLKY